MACFGTPGEEDDMKRWDTTADTKSFKEGIHVVFSSIGEELCREPSHAIDRTGCATHEYTILKGPCCLFFTRLDMREGQHMTMKIDPLMGSMIAAKESMEVAHGGHDIFCDTSDPKEGLYEKIR
jgi:hypothetical protein